MRIFLLGIIAGLLIPVSSYAKDSVWILGNNNKVAINVFEHRVGAEHRAAEVTLIMGSWFLNGQLKDSGQGYANPTPINLTTKSGSFKGTISVDFAKNKVTLKGTLTLDGEPIPLNEVIPCKELKGI
jgi:hypothetical protein